ncbi:lysophospholipid acyltransferase family protein [Candidatus Desantisbacteria bacterium]|nr:lysophospholipid acyltransferase family protein [Candidatus Desantisbacteria bacterium]
MLEQIKEKILYIILPLIAKILIRLLFCTIRLRVVGEENAEGQTQDSKIQVIYAFWHGQQFLLVPYMSHRDIILMSSLSRDGEYQARILQRFGYKIVRGSSAKGGMRGLIGLIKGMRDGHDCGLAVDGPTGPIYEPKEGIIALARKTGAYIVPLVSATRHKWTFEAAWDKYVLPKPFSHGLIAFGQPYKVGIDTSMQQECDILKQRLNALSDKAEHRIQELEVRSQNEKPASIL